MPPARPSSGPYAWARVEVEISEVVSSLGAGQACSIWAEAAGLLISARHQRRVVAGGSRWEGRRTVHRHDFSEPGDGTGPGFGPRLISKPMRCAVVRATDQNRVMPRSASGAARDLAEVLTSEAAHLDSDDLETISAAMTRIRSTARGLADRISDRGWGGGLLFGFGEPGKWDHQARNDLEIEELIQFGELDADWADSSMQIQQPTIPEGRRVTYQARVDYVVTDEIALRTYVRKRLAEQADLHLDEDLLVRNPFLVLTLLDGLEHHDYANAGLYPAGCQVVARTVPTSLSDLDDDSQDDAFPTVRP